VGHDAYAPGGAADGSIEHVRATQAARRLTLAFGAELETAGASDDGDVRPSRQPSDDFLADTVREVLQLRVARKVVEGQYRDDPLRQGGSARRSDRRLRSAVLPGCRPQAAAHGASTQGGTDRRNDEACDRGECGNAAQQGFVPADPVQDLLEARHAAASPGLTGRRCCMVVAASTTLTPRRRARDASGVAVLRRTARDDPHDSL
jgi:hypothetical protein